MSAVFGCDGKTDCVINLRRLLLSVKVPDGEGTGYKLFFDNGKTIEVTERDGQIIARTLRMKATYPVATISD